MNLIYKDFSADPDKIESLDLACLTYWRSKMCPIATKFNTPALLYLEPGLRDIFSRLSADTDSFFLTDAGSLPTLFEEQDHHLPVVFLSSERLQQLSEDGPDTSDPCIVLGDYDPNYFSSCYLAWRGKQFCIAIDSTELFSIFFRTSRGPAQAFIVWVTESATSISLLTVDEEFVDLLEAARRACSLPRFVAGRGLPPFLNSDHSSETDTQEVVISGFRGLRVHVAVSSCD
jgi:hypothetical protein